MIIDLATFNLNTDKIFADLVKTRSEIQKLKDSQKELQKEFTNSNKSVADNQKNLDKLNSELQGLTKGTSSYNQTLALRDKAETELNNSLLEQSRINESYQQELTRTQLEINKLSNQARSYQTVLDTQNRSTNENIDLYTRQRAELSLLQKEQRELGSELIKMKDNGQENTQEFKDLSKAYSEASEKANTLAEDLREVDTAGGNFTSTIGNYKTGFEDFKKSLLSGDIKGAVSGLTSSISGLFKTLVANPIIGLVAGIVASGKAIFDFNQQIAESNKLLDNLGLDKKIRPQIDGLVKSFGVGFKEVSNAVDQIMDLGLAKDQADALEQIKLGLVKAPDKQAFLSALENNSVAAKNLGINLNEVIALQESFEATGSNAEATFGALEKAQLNLTKTNKDVAETLSATLGSGFSQDILSKVQSGAITYTQALDKIFKKGEELKISNQQQADLQVALFGKSAVSAGGYEQILQNISNAQNKQIQELTDKQKATLDLANANQELEKALSKAFEIDGFTSSWDSFKASATLMLANIINYLGDLKEEIQPLIDLVGEGLAMSWESVKIVFSNAFDIILGTIKNVKIVISGLVDFIKAVFKGDVNGAINVVGDTFKKLLFNIQNTLNKIRNTIIDGVKSLLNSLKPILETLGIDVTKLQKRLDGLKGVVIETKKENKTLNETTTKTTNQTGTQTPKANTDNKAVEEAKKAREKALKDLEEAQKKEFESQQKFADEKVKLAKQELDIYISKNKSILENEKFLTKALAEEEKKRLVEVQDKKDEYLKSEFDLQNGRLQAQIDTLNKKQNLNNTEKNQLQTLLLQQSELQNKYNADLLATDEERQKAQTEIDKRYSNERIEAEKVRKAIQYQTQLLELEAQGVSEFEIKQAQLDQQKQLELEKLIETADAKIQAGIEKRLQENSILTQEEALKSELEAELKATNDENERIRLQNQLDQLGIIEQNAVNKSIEINKAKEQAKRTDASNTFGQIADLVGQETSVGKAAALAQATLSGINAVQNAFSTAQKSPITAVFPAYPYIQAGLAGAFTALQIKKIAGFSEGGYTGRGGKYEPAGIVHKEEVVFSQADVKALGGADIVDSMRPTSKGYANNGIVGNVSNLGSIQTQITNSGIDTEVLANIIGEKVMLGAMAGTENGSARGIGNYSENLEIRNGSKF